MSRIGRIPVAIPAGVTVEVNASTTPETGGTVKVQGPKGELHYQYLSVITVKVEGKQVLVGRKEETDAARALHGLTRQLIANMVIGVKDGFEKKLEIIGVGYKVQVKGNVLVLSLGHSHPINYKIPEGIAMTQEEKNANILIIRGIDKQLVGQVAAVIRGMRPPEPYKGKGVRYIDEYVRRKAGKAAVAKGAVAAA